MTDSGAATWRPDVLGDGFEQRDLALPGGQVATLVRYTGRLGKTKARPAVLYLHGFVDYFFQAHQAKAFARRGYRFYAVDLRGYGRSIGRGNNDPTPNYVPNIGIYAQDLDAAARAISSEGHSTLVAVGHSTGGLIMPLWAQSRPELIEAMVLNSPWLDYNANWLLRGPVSQTMRFVGAVAPRVKIGGLKAFYGRALHQQTGGEWDFDLAWKPHDGFPVAASWFSSVRRAQARVKNGLDLPFPLLVMTALKKGNNLRPHPDLVTTDSVLDPRQMWRLAPKLGLNVEVQALAEAAHDLALSPEPTRSRYSEQVLNWLDQVLQP
ncbi:MAG: alpha/beta hydrolase [Micrococcales bacterium]|nr:alpha/beta hydrolase [Micrococcales bacterium]